MAFTKGLGTYRGVDFPKGGLKNSNSNFFHSSRHRNLMNKKKPKKKDS